jgi:hypothetical protein
MPFMILYGGELAFAFLGARIARWMWRSREHVLALWRERNGAPPSGGPSFEPDPLVQLVARPARRATGVDSGLRLLPEVPAEPRRRAA